MLVGSGPAKSADVITPEYQAGLSHAYDSDETVAARDNILTATPRDDGIKAQVVADSRASAQAARTEWPPRGIAQDITSQAQKIDVPVLVIAGEHVQVETADVLRHNLLPYLAHADFTVIPAAGHLIPLEAPAKLPKSITGFAV